MYPDSFKPIRNKLKNLDVKKSLFGIWTFARYRIDRCSLPGKMMYGTKNGGLLPPKDFVHPWDLEVLLKNLVLYGTHKSANDCIDSFGKICHLGTLVRNYDDELSKFVLNDDIFSKMHLLIFQQWYWNSGVAIRAKLRFYEICCDSRVLARVEDFYSCDPIRLYFLAHFFHAQACGKPLIFFSEILKIPGFSALTLSKVYERAVIDFCDYKSELESSERFDKGWFYTPNALRKYPVIKMSDGDLICPIPSFFLRRFTDGLYFDILEGSNGGEILGKAFEGHVYRVANKFLSDNYSVIDEKPYRVGKNDKHGFDVKIVSDSLCLFVECKVAKANVNSLSRMELGAGFDKIIDAVVQAYKNYSDVISGCAGFDLADRDAMLLVVTLENWYSEMPNIIEWLTSEVKTRLLAINFEVSIFDKVPFLVVSCEDFEVMCHVTSIVGIDNFFSKFKSAISTSMHGLIHGEYSDIVRDMPWQSIFRLSDDISSTFGSANV